MKKLIIGLVIGLMLGMSTNAFAAIGDKVQAVFAEFNYVVNAQTKSIESPVLVYEGVSYLRTTDIGNMLGYDVTYKSDSRTIEFNNPEPVMTLAPTSTPAPGAPFSITEATPTPEPSTGPTPTPDPNATPTPTPDPNATPEPSTEPTATPTATPTAEPTPSPTPEPTVTPTPTPAPSNVAQCQAIRDRWTLAIYGYHGSNPADEEYQRRIMGSQRDSELSAAGC